MVMAAASAARAGIHGPRRLEHLYRRRRQGTGTDFWWRLCRAPVTICAAAALTGCAAGAPPPSAVRTVTVQVPIVRQVPCPAPALDHPALPIAGLKADSPPADTMRAYAAAVAILKGAVLERDSVLAGCAHPASRPAPARSAS
jgi:hypothetical protein